MKKNIFALCDLEISYAHNFMEYLNQKRNIPFEIQAFTSPRHLCDYAATHPIEILLISDKAMCQEVKGLMIEKIIILSEGVHNPELDQYPSVYKYQSSAAVVREVMNCYGEEKKQHTPLVVKRPMEIIGVYSPLGRVLKTSFALTLGQLLARDRAVLYLNLEEYSGFESLFNMDFERNLGDLLYYVRQSHANLIHKLSAMVQSVNNLDYLPPVTSPMDIRMTSYEEWERLLEEIRMNSSYEVVIVDFSDGVDEMYHLLEKCSRIYMPVLGDILSQAKIRQFENLLRMWDCQAVLTKLVRISLPFHNSFGDGKNYVEQLMWSQLGDFTRELLRKEE